ncbi:MAG: hypothetical protein AB7O26_04175 [Planctomycetaceae bacterium]
MSSAKPTDNRIASLDQFRGYTVAGMFLVNCLGSFAAVPYLWRHHNTFCSYADTIMPQFFFAVGFAYRLTFGRRAQADGLSAAYWRAVKRFLGLALVAIVVYGSGNAARTWSELTEKGIGALYDPIKSDWFQTLMHIAVTSLWILPVIRAGAGVRIAYLVGSAVLHAVLSQWFYFEWIHAKPGCIDGGPLGFLTWSIPTLVGTLACDAIAGSEGRASKATLGKMIVWGVLLMLLGYGFSCGTRMYDIDKLPGETARTDDDAGRPIRDRNSKRAESPVIPPKEARDAWFASLRAGKWNEVLAEPPFTPPRFSRQDEQEQLGLKRYATTAYWLEPAQRNEKNESALYRKENYWMMSQRAGSISYLTFAAGLALILYVLFYELADILGARVGVFRTLGVNALVGYILHGMVDRAVTAFMPRDSPGWYMFAGFAVYFFITWLFLRTLEKNRIFVKL